MLNGYCFYFFVRQRFIMKYEIEIDKLLKELLYDESWMDDKDYKEVIDLTFKTMGITKQKLSDDIEIGVNNGYTVEQQIELLKRVLNVAQHPNIVNCKIVTYKTKTL